MHRTTQLPMRVCKRSVDKVPGAKGLSPGSCRLLAFRAFLFLSTSEAAAAHLHQLVQLISDTCQGANEFPQACSPTWFLSLQNSCLQRSTFIDSHLSLFLNNTIGNLPRLARKSAAECPFHQEQKSTSRHPEASPRCRRLIPSTVCVPDPARQGAFIASSARH